MRTTSDAAPPLAPDPLMDLALSRLSACPRVTHGDLLACLTSLRSVRRDGDDREQHLAVIDRYYARAISTSSKGLEHHEDRALTLMTIAITELRDNTPSSNAQAERALRQIRMTAD